MTAGAANAAVAVYGLSRRFGAVTALDDISLEVERGSFLSLLGPSGCGKTTLLRIIAGLEHPDSGELWIDGRPFRREPPNRRPVNLVFQRYALFPHKTVAENVGFALHIKRAPREEIRRRVEEMLELVRLPGFGDRRIDELSGGQAQRVALARALIDDPPVLLLDEPLAALDLKLRQAMHIELRQIQRRVGSTFIYVTHDQEEALVLSDKVVVMDHGRIVQVGSPHDVYHRPATRFAATFLGEANLFRGKADVVGETFNLTAGQIRLVGRTRGARHLPGDTWVVVRPERIQIAREQHERREADRPFGVDTNRVLGVVSDVVFLGSVLRYVVDTPAGALIVDRASADDVAGDHLARGSRVELSWDFDAAVAVADDPR